MFKTLCALPLVIFTSLSFASPNSTLQGGFQGPNSTPKLTVSQVQNEQDDSLVSITGHIISTNGDEKYVFEDKTGEIEVEIDDDLFQNLTVTPETSVTIVGEVGKEWNELSIDADALLIN